MNPLDLSVNDYNKKKNVIDKRKIRLEEVTKDEYIPFLGGRPERDTIINQDDITNLIIALNTQTIEQLTLTM